MYDADPTLPTSGFAATPTDPNQAASGAPAMESVQSVHRAAGGGAPPHATVTETYPVDAPVSFLSNLVFVTTGPAACTELGEFPNQVTLTPMVAYRIGELLRCILQYPDIGSRTAVCDQWNEDEAPYVPHGRVEATDQGVQFGIEPIGAGVLVSVLWEHVPGLSMQLDHVARTLMTES